MPNTRVFLEDWLFAMGGTEDCLREAQPVRLPHTWSVEEGREVRTIEKEKNGASEKIETITLSDGKIVIENHLRGYSYQLDLLEE